MSFTPSEEEIDEFCNAAGAGDCVGIAAFLSDYGAEFIDSLDQRHSSALACAVMHGREDAVRLLLDNGAAIEPQNKRNLTALIFAAWYGHRPIVALLLERGALINTQAGSDGQTALIWAATLGHTDIAALLLERGASVEAKDFNGQTALMQAQKHHKDDVVKLIEQYLSTRIDVLTETRLEQIRQLPKIVLKRGM